MNRCYNKLYGTSCCIDTCLYRPLAGFAPRQAVRGSFPQKARLSQPRPPRLYILKTQHTDGGTKVHNCTRRCANITFTSGSRHDCLETPCVTVATCASTGGAFHHTIAVDIHPVRAGFSAPQDGLLGLQMVGTTNRHIIEYVLPQSSE